MYMEINANNSVGCVGKFSIFFCCALIEVQIKCHVLNGFPDSGGPPASLTAVKIGYHNVP